VWVEGWVGRLYILVFSLRNLKKILRSLSPTVLPYTADEPIDNPFP
jgi:hypothetical protein